MGAVDTVIRRAVQSDLEAIKAIADAERDALGFITRSTVREAIKQGHMIVATIDGEVVGFQHYYHRKQDLQTRLYHKAVDPEWRMQGIGTALVDAVVNEARALDRRRLLLKCPVELSSNKFHERYGFTLIGQEPGRKRRLNIWEYIL